MESFRLAIIIPCYNESKTLGEIVRVCALTGDVFVIDDGSTDNSAEIARTNGATVVKTSGRTGYDKVIEHGLRTCFPLGYSHFITIDADGEHDPAITKQFADSFRSNPIDLVLGIRPAPQRLAEHYVCHYCRLKFGVTDILCGMKGYSRKLVSEYVATDAPTVINMWPAIMWITLGGRFSQIPVTGKRRTDQPRFQSRMRANKMIMAGLSTVLKMRKTLLKKPEGRVSSGGRP